MPSWLPQGAHPLKVGLTLFICLLAAETSLGQTAKKSDGELFGGKTLDEWISQAKKGPKLADRHEALQTLRNLGIARDRKRTLRVFTELLSDSAPTVRSLAAVGISKAGKPADPKAAEKLLEILSKDLTDLKFPRGTGEVGAEFGGVVRAIGALEVIGETEHIPSLKQIADNKKVESIIRQVAQKAIRQIERRADKQTRDSATEKD